MDLSFCVMIESDKSEAELIEILLSEINDSILVGGHIKTSGNVIKFENNSLLDKVKANDQSDDFWLYFKFSVSIFPIEDRTVKQQSILAKNIINTIRNTGNLAEIIADFTI